MRKNAGSRRPLWLCLGLAATALLLALGACGSAGAGTAAPERAGSATTEPPATAVPSMTTATVLDGLEVVRVADLPPEARRTLNLIARGGPFPYQRDGAVFANRERLLPRRGSGYYHEYTVPTPGENDRGARRIIADASGECYYTDDHYASFRRVVT